MQCLFILFVKYFLNVTRSFTLVGKSNNSYNKEEKKKKKNCLSIYCTSYKHVCH